MKQKRLLKMKTKQNIFVWTMLAIPIANFLLFWLYVNFDSILLAFRNLNMRTGNEYWTFDNFTAVFKKFTTKTGNYNLVDFGLNTLKFWSLGVFWGIPHSILLTYVFHRKLKGYKFFRIVLYLPTIICAVVIAGIFASFISGNGALGKILTDVFNVSRVPDWFAEPEWATKMLLIYSFFFGFAGHYVIFSGAIARVDQDIMDVARLEGATMWQELWYVYIPLMWPTISMTIITSFAGIFGASGQILLFTPYMESTYTFGYWIFNEVRLLQSYYLPATLGLCFTIVAFPLCLLVRKLVESIYSDVD